MKYYVSAVSNEVRSDGNFQTSVMQGIRAEFIDMPDDYKISDDTINCKNPFQQLRTEFCKVAQSRIVPYSVREAWIPERVTILGVTAIPETRASESVTLDSRIAEAISRLRLDAQVSDVLPFLPDCAIDLDDQSFDNSVYLAVKSIDANVWSD